MRTTMLLVLIHLTFSQVYAQTILKMELMNGKQVLPCKVNGIVMKFSMDTGEDDATISLTDALFLLKNGYASASDLSGSEYERFSVGHITAETTLLLKQIFIGNTRIDNVRAKVIADLRSPLVFGQNVLKRLERIEFDYSNQLVTLRGGKNNDPNTMNTAVNPTPIPNYSVTKTSSNPTPDIKPAEKQEKLLVKVNTNLYALPNQGPAIHTVLSNTFVKVLGDNKQDDNYLYVDYLGNKGYINRYALDIKQ